jgi:hypothetical protein
MLLAITAAASQPVIAPNGVISASGFGGFASVAPVGNSCGFGGAWKEGSADLLANAQTERLDRERADRHVQQL